MSSIPDDVDEIRSLLNYEILVARGLEKKRAKKAYKDKRSCDQLKSCLLYQADSTVAESLATYGEMVFHNLCTEVFEDILTPWNNTEGHSAKTQGHRQALLESLCEETFSSLITSHAEPSYPLEYPFSLLSLNNERTSQLDEEDANETDFEALDSHVNHTLYLNSRRINGNCLSTTPMVQDQWLVEEEGDCQSAVEKPMVLGLSLTEARSVWSHMMLEEEINESTWKPPEETIGGGLRRVTRLAQCEDVQERVGRGF